MSVSIVDWQGFSGFRLESDALSVVTLPALGGKIVSIFDKRLDYEWLVHPRRPLRGAQVGDRFEDYDLSGWDEMFPTIAACRFVDAQGDVFDLPDHGEVWALRWTPRLSNSEGLTLAVDGRFQPYTLERQITLIEPASLLLQYRLTSRARSKFPFIWAAHPLFRAFPDTKLTFDPPDLPMIKVSPQPLLRDHDTNEVIPFPEATLISGQIVDLSRVGQEGLYESRKFYVHPDQRARAVRLEHPSLSAALDMQWSGAVVRYLGLWIDERTHSIDYVMAPEPCTGFYDALTTAVAHGQVAFIAPDERLEWSLRVDCSAFCFAER